MTNGSLKSCYNANLRFDKMSEKKIQLMIIGAQKAGTTSLKQYLGTHPEEETTFFVNDKEYSEQGARLIGSQFTNATVNSVLVAKSVGVMYHELALLRVRAHNPSITVVAVLRNPVDRAYSAFWYARRKGWEPLDRFEDALQAPADRFGDDWISRRNCDYLARGEYSRYIADIFKLFPRERVKLFKFEDLRDDPIRICQELWSALGVDETLGILPETSKRHNVSAMPKYQLVASLLKNMSIPASLASHMPTQFMRTIKAKIVKWNEEPFTPQAMSMEARELLREYYKEFNNELESLTGLDVSSWNY